MMLQSLSAFEQNIECLCNVLILPQGVQVMLMGVVIWTVFVVHDLCDLKLLWLDLIGINQPIPWLWLLV